MKQIAIGFAVLGVAICAVVAWHELASTQPRILELGQLLVVTLTLVVLVWYAYDTNSIARITQDRWIREHLKSATRGAQLFSYIMLLLWSFGLGSIST